MSESMEPLKARRFRLRLSLRLTMAVVLVVGLALGSVITKARRQAETVERVRRLGGQVGYDWENPGYAMSLSVASEGPKWLTDRVGPDYNHDVTMVSTIGIQGGIDDSWVGRIAELRKLGTLHLGFSSSFTSVGLARLSGLDPMPVR